MSRRSEMICISEEVKAKLIELQEQPEWQGLSLGEIARRLILLGLEADEE